MRKVLYFVLRHGFALLGLIFVLVYFIATREMKTRVTAFPHLFVYLAVGFFGWIVVTDAILHLRKKHAEQESPIKWQIAWPPLTVIAGILAYIVLMSVLGFMTATTLFLAGMMVVLGERRLLTLSLVTAGTVLVCWLVFRQWLHVPFPSGLIG
ncbi:MAG: tripartite tricarboxylate transporter TctB family protein [Proteobacteria bacterium]|nr:tripartite tricarboxylate transporter TctB family protein [Pseudomonadota bacterium]MBU2226764.1 tripartite tricarboxylate transporter TctB family protein [Pseudomonadota bacterium]